MISLYNGGNGKRGCCRRFTPPEFPPPMKKQWRLIASTVKIEPTLFGYNHGTKDEEDTEREAGLFISQFELRGFQGVPQVRRWESNITSIS